jgi:hypothetical protein
VSVRYSGVHGAPGRGSKNPLLSTLDEACDSLDGPMGDVIRGAERSKLIITPSHETYIHRR